MTNDPSNSDKHQNREEWVLEARESEIVTLTFNDPEHRNAMTQTMGEAFRDRIQVLASELA